MKKAYIFRGSPSSGKGTITKRFIEKLKGKVALLELDTFRWNFHLLNREVKDISEEEHRFAYENYLMMLDRYCENGQYTLVMEGLFGYDGNSVHGCVQDHIEILEKHGFDYQVILIYGDKEIIWERNLKREYSVPREEFDELYNYIMSEIKDNEVKIDVTELGINETLDKLIRKLNL